MSIDIFNTFSTSMGLNTLISVFSPVMMMLTDVGITSADHSKLSLVLAGLFNLLNAAVLFLGSIYIIIHAASAVLRTAHEGEVMGKSWSSMWVPLRLSLGFAVLLPLSNGYSLVQTGILQFATWGSNLADNVTIFVAPRFTTIEVDHLIKLDAESIAPLALDAFNSSLCIQSANKATEKYNTAMRSFGFQDRPNVMSIMKVSGEGGRSIWMYGDMLSHAKHQKMNVVSINSMYSPDARTCGEIAITSRSFENENPLSDTLLTFGNMNLDDSESREQIKQFDDNYTLYQQGRLAALIAGIDALANDFVRAPDGADSMVMAARRMNVMKKLTNLIVQYDRENQLWLIEERKKVKFSAVMAKELLDKINKEGWMSFGSYYVKLITLSMSTQAVSNISLGNISYIPPSTEELTPDSREERELVMQSLSNTVSEFSSQVKSGAIKFYNTFGAVGSYNAIVSFGNKIDDKIKDGDFDPMVIKIKTEEALVDALMDLNEQVKFTDESIENPVLYAQHTGILMVNAAAKISAGAVVIATLSGTTPASMVGADAAWEFVSPYVRIVVGILVAIGLFLSLWLAWQPFAIWTMGIVSWLSSVVEAVIIGPIWAISFLNPEGEGFTGQRAQQGFLLILSVFLRPVLMLAGIISAMIISDAVFKFIATASSNISLDLNPKMGLAMIAFMVLGKLIVTAVIMVTAQTTIFQLIHVIPDNVLRWIGGGREGLGDLGGTSMAEGMIQRQGGQMASGAVGAFAGAATGSKRVMSAIAEKKKRK